MKIQVLTLIALMFAAVAQAGPSVSGGIGMSDRMHCESADGTYKLDLSNNIGTIWKAQLLVSSNEPISMSCPQKFNPTSWACAETRGGEGRFGIYLTETRKGAAGELLHEQVYPLQPKKVAVLRCRLVDKDPNQRN